MHGILSSSGYDLLLLRLLDDPERHPAHVARPPRLEPQILYVLYLLIETFIFEPVGIDLCLIVLQLGDHVLQLFRPLLQVLLVDLQFLSDLGPRLLRQDVLELNVELLLLLDEHIFLTHFLCLRDETLLETLDLLDQFIGLRVRALQLSPSVHVQGLF